MNSNFCNQKLNICGAPNKFIILNGHHLSYCTSSEPLVMHSDTALLIIRYNTSDLSLSISDLTY